MAAVLLAGVLRIGGVNLLVMFEAAVKGVLIFLIGFVAFLPYHVNYETAFSSIEGTTNQTVLWQFLLIAGLFVFVIGSFVVSESRSWLFDLGRIVWRPFSKLVAVPIRLGQSGVTGTHLKSNRKRASHARRIGAMPYWACCGAEAGGDYGQHDAVRVRARRSGAGDGGANRVLHPPGCSPDGVCVTAGAHGVLHRHRRGYLSHRG